MFSDEMFFTVRRIIISILIEGFVHFRKKDKKGGSPIMKEQPPKDMIGSAANR